MRTTPDETIYKRMVEAAQGWHVLRTAHSIMEEHDELCDDCLGHLYGRSCEKEAVAEELLEILALKCPHCGRELTTSDFWSERASCFKCGLTLRWSDFEQAEEKA